MRLFTDFKYKLMCFFNLLSMIVLAVGFLVSLITGSIVWQIITAIAAFVFFNVQLRLPSG